jgi:hypothetical protein
MRTNCLPLTLLVATLTGGCSYTGSPVDPSDSKLHAGRPDARAARAVSSTTGGVAVSSADSTDAAVQRGTHLIGSGN